jgi:signal transduction histidine kinase
VSAPRSLRWRLTRGFSGIAAVVVVAAAMGMLILVERAVWDPLDAAIEEEAETLAGIQNIAPAEELARAVARIGSEIEPGPGKVIRVTAPGGAILAEAGRMPTSLATLAAPSAPITRHETIGRGAHAYRVVWYAADGGGWSEVAVRAGAQVQMLWRARVAIVAGAALLLVTFAILAWAMTTRATSELARVAAELETIEAGSLDRRLVPRRTTEVDRLATVLNRLLARLEAAMGHLRRFTGDAAHELRTPVAALRARLEVTIARANSADAYREGLLDALEQTERLARLTEDLLTLSAVEAGTAGARSEDETVLLDELVREVAESLEPVAQEQGRPFTWNVTTGVGVRGSSPLLKRLVLNLVDNAFRHTPPNAEVSVTARSLDGSATVEVTDRGPGIAPADRTLVFERFRRGRGVTTSGSGLGLALCQEIVSRHRGRIVLDSVPGRGTTVTVILPAVGSVFGA